jgi:hypothetical protein
MPQGNERQTYDLLGKGSNITIHPRKKGNLLENMNEGK